MPEDRKTAGRPRDEAAGSALKAAAVKLVSRQGYGHVSITAIIAEAGVSRQSLYRRWPTKADLVLEAFFEAAGAEGEPKIDPASPSPIRDALLSFLLGIFDHLERDADSLRSLIASAQEDPQFRKSFLEKFVLPREEIVMRMLESAIECGELAQDADVDVLSSALHGAFWYRILNDKPIDTELAKALIDLVFR